MSLTKKQEKATTEPKAEPKKTRVRRTEEQRIADLQAEIERLRIQKETKHEKQSPIVQHTAAAIRAINAANKETAEDDELPVALDKAYKVLTAYFKAKGYRIPTMRERKKRKAKE